ncbi:unnamed protein product [Diabrotica balteata]|uniref:Calponin-homology (CH) domain-containing protein n=1 Tax=Diabrotica balteata TaxID=107213 RepID=A0A9N9T0C1_DIABA|nr:unnamed protein product [Diabrotica balteata]
MEEDQIEKPQTEILFRQCSIETPLTPSRYSPEDEFFEESKDVPKIVDCKKKSQMSMPDKPVPNTKPQISPRLKSRSPVFENREVNNTEMMTTEHQMRAPLKPLVSPKPKPNSMSPMFENVKMSDSDEGNISPTASKQFRNKLEHIYNSGENHKTPSPRTSVYDNNTNESHDILRKSSVSSLREELSKKLEIGFKKDVVLHDPPSNDSRNSSDAWENDGHMGKETMMTEIKEEEERSVGLLKALHRKKDREQDKDGDNTVGGASQRNEDMATLRPKSPRPVPLKGEKEETIWDKLGTLGRKKRIKEVQEVQAEGKHAIDSPGCPTAPIIPPEDYNLEDNEERCMIDPRAYDDPKFYDLLNVLKEWINDELASQRIIVQDLSEDLYDGQVLQKLLEKLTGDKFDVPEVTQSEEGQKQKLMVVLDHFNKVLGIQRLSHNKWNVESIHSKNIVAITHLLVALARHFRPPVRLPEHVSVEVVVVQKASGRLVHKTVRESLTKAYDDVGMRCERDAFDTLFDHAPDKLQVVKKSLVTFVNKHLNKMNFEVTEIESQFHDGVYLIMLMGLLEGFFVPHYSFHLTPHEFEQKVHNVNFAFELMEEVGLQKPKARPEDVVNMDLKSTLRVLYNIFLRYRTII